MIHLPRRLSWSAARLRLRRVFAGEWPQEDGPKLPFLAIEVVEKGKGNTHS